MKNHSCALPSLKSFTGWLFLVILITASGCSKKEDASKLPDSFNSLSTPDKMEYLMSNMPADSVARVICDAALGKLYNARIDLQDAIIYVYEHYNEDDQVKFDLEYTNYIQQLPLHEKVRLTKIAGLEEIDPYSYGLGLEYVGEIREQHKTEKEITEDLANLQKECKTDPDFYKRFMKGFKTALEYDRHHDFDDKIYNKFITYPDTIK